MHTFASSTVFYATSSYLATVLNTGVLYTFLNSTSCNPSFQGVFFGLSVGFGVYPALAVVGQYFNRRRGLAMGIVASGSSLGGVCLPIMFSRLFDTVGFGECYNNWPILY